MDRLRKTLTLSCLVLLCTLCRAQGGTWTWVKGPNTTNSGGNIGSKGIPNAANFPEGRYQSANWIDHDGNFWIFGGLDTSGNERQDLWRYQPTTNIWTWINGPIAGLGSGAYGTQGTPSPNNIPGARAYGVVSWTDQQGRLWLHGGQGYDVNGRRGNLDDLWMYNIATDQWTWMKGADTIDAPAIYGTLHVPISVNTPGGRYECNTSWVRSDGTLWTFGGVKDVDSAMNDMWRFDIAINCWTWMSGRPGPTTARSYGTMFVEDPGNLPPARGTYTRWQDPQDNFYIFGGWSINNLNRNDVWRYNTNNNQWTWIGGSQNISDQGQYTRLCTPGHNALPPARYENRTAQTVNCADVFWTFGGLLSHSPNFNITNDLWNFNIRHNEWTWVSGSNIPNSLGSYGSINVPSSSNTPPARFGVCMWVDTAGQIWVWGGMDGSSAKFSDMLTFAPDTACINSALVLYPTSTYFVNSDLCHYDTARLTVNSGRVISITPSAGSLLIDSTHVSFRPAVPTTYQVITWGLCSGYDTFSYAVPAATSSVVVVDTFLCHGYKFLFDTDSLASSGTYHDTLRNVMGCDSFITLHLTIDSAQLTFLSKVVCLGLYTVFGHDTLYQQGTYSDTLTSMRGCDSIVTLNFTTVPAFYDFIHIPLCPGETVIIKNHLYDSTATIYDTLVSLGGCDSIIETDIYQIKYVFGATTALICNGTSMVYAGRTISQPGIYNDTINRPTGCDSIVQLSLYVYEPSPHYTDVQVCLYDSFYYKGRYITVGGVFNDTIRRQGLCDSIASLYLSFQSQVTQRIHADICPGSGVNFGHRFITTAGTFIDTLSSRAGCDSIVTLTTTMLPSSADGLSAYICRGHGLRFHGDSISTPGTYSYHMTNIYGCDSLITLSVYALSTPVDTVRRTICDGDSVFFSGRKYTIQGAYSDTFVSPEGCDSIITLVLTVLPQPVSRFVIEPATHNVDMSSLIALTNLSTYADSVLWLLNNHAITLLSGGTLPVNDTGTYCIRLIITARGGCADTSTQCIYLYNNSFYMPNAFTPNSDGLNDYIELYGMKTGIKYLSIRIYDRWGEKMFESEDLDFRWDGKYRGTMMQPNVYVYTLDISYIDGHVVHNKGSITLIR